MNPFDIAPARIIFNDYSHNSSALSIKSRLSLSLLSTTRPIAHLSLLHKAFYTAFSKIYLLNLLTYILSRRDHLCKIARPKSASQAHQHSLIPEEVDWNDLPGAIVTISNPKQFLLDFQHHTFTNPLLRSTPSRH